MALSFRSHVVRQWVYDTCRSYTGSVQWVLFSVLYFLDQRIRALPHHAIVAARSPLSSILNIDLELVSVSY